MGVGRLDLQVLGGVGVDDPEPVVEAGHQHDARLRAGERLGDALGMPRGGDLAGKLLLDGLGERLAGGDQHGGGDHVVLGLADQVGGDVDGVGGVVGEHGDLGRARLGVDADAPLEQALGGGDPDVAGTGDHADRGALLGAVGEHRHRLGAAHGVHLVDAEQRAGRQDGRVGQPSEAGLRRGGDRQGGHPRLLGGHDVHHDARRVDRAPAGDVEADPVDGHPALGDRAAGDDLGGGVGPALVAVDQARPADGLLQRGAHGGVEPGEGAGEGLGGHAGGAELHTVEPGGQLPHGRHSPMAHVVADGPHLGKGGLDVKLGAGQHVAQVVRQGPAQVDTGYHRSSLRRVAPRSGCGPPFGRRLYIVDFNLPLSWGP